MTQFEEMIVNDDKVSLPKIEDYYYNSLTPDMNSGLLKEKELFYSEMPPGGEDAIGFSPDGTIFTIHSGSTKDKSLAFILDWSEEKDKKIEEHSDEIFTNVLDGNTVRFYEDKCKVGDNEQAKQFLDQLVKDPALSDKEEPREKEPAKENDKNSVEQREPDRKGIGYCKMLFYKAPEIPHYTIAYLPKQDVLESKMKYKEIDDEYSQYIHATYKPEIVVIKEKIEENKEEFKGTRWIPDDTLERYKVKYEDEDDVYFFHNRQVWDITPADMENDDWGRYLSISRDAKDSEEVPFGYKARDIMYRELSTAEDTRICISSNALRENNRPYVQEYGRWYFDENALNRIDESITKFLNNGLFEQDIKYSGYNLAGQERDKTLLTVIYVKKNIKDKNGNIKKVWINLNKYMIYELHGMAKEEGAIIGDSPKELYMSNYAPQCFAPKTYDYEERAYVDSWENRYENAAHRIERRIGLQKKCFEKAGYGSLSEQELTNWTVSIGDVTFFVPPESIRIITQTTSERLPLLRVKGTMNKFSEKADKQIELSLFFNEDMGINGLPIETELWHEQDASGNKIIYYMNGLRSLISEFKFTPFLPIVNSMVNDVLKVFTVALENLVISTVPGFPRLYQATLVLRSIDYAIYMPELPEPYIVQNEDGTQHIVNPFASSINYDLLRYYYQKPLLKGNELASKLYNADGTKNKNYNVNTKEFIEDTVFSGRTALIPCRFIESNIDIYIADEDHLKKLYSLKKDTIKNKYRKSASDTFIPTCVEEDFIRDIGSLFANDDIHEAIRELYIRYFNLKKAAKKANRSESNEATEIDDGDFNPKDWNETDVETARKKAIKYYVENMRYQVVPLAQAFKRQQNKLNNIDGEPIIKDIIYDVNSGILEVELNTPYVRNADSIKNLLAHFANDMNFKEDEVYDVFKNNLLRIDLKRLSWWQYPDAGKKADQPLYELELLKWCYLDGNDMISANRKAADLKEASDWENINSLKYELVGKDIRVSKFSARMENTFSQVSVLDSSSYAMQYMGGQDVTITWEIETMNKNFATLMQSLPEYEAYCMRNYSLVLPSFPIKIDSEFTRFLGVFEVSIENVVVTTVPNHPGLYNIAVTAISTDRTMRNREALKSIDRVDTPTEKIYSVVIEIPSEEKETMKNILSEMKYENNIDKDIITDTEVKINRLPSEDYKKINDSITAKGLKTKIIIVKTYEKRNVDSGNISGSLDNFGAAQGDIRTQINIKTYEDLSDKLAKAEIYPDLELPTIGELTDLGFRFMRYKDKERQRSDLYVDPDFYFDYPEALISEVIRSVVQAMFSDENKDKLTSNVELSDKTGAKTKITPDGKINMDTANDKLKSQITKANTDVSRETKAIKDFESNEFAKKYPAFFLGEPEKWDISTKISCSFLEETFLSLKRLKDGGYAELQPSEKDSESVKEEKKKKLEKYKELGDFYDDKFKDIEKGISRLDEDLRTELSDGNKEKWIELNYLSGIFPDNDAIENDSFKESVKNMFYGVGDALHGRYEYNSKLDELDWQVPEYAYYATLLSPDKQEIRLRELSDVNRLQVEMGGLGLNKHEQYEQQKLEEAQKQHLKEKTKKVWHESIKDNEIIRASKYDIHSYSYNDIIRLLPPEEAEELKKYDEELRKKEPDKVHKYVLDPYYRLHYEKAQEYLSKCIFDEEYAKAAFARNVCWWLNLLYKKNVFPSLTIDVLRSDSINVKNAADRAVELVDEMYQKEVGKKGKDKDSSQVNKYKNELISVDLLENLADFAQNQGHIFDSGKVFLAITMYLYDKPLDSNHILYPMVSNRNYEGLQEKLKQICYFNNPDKENLVNPDIRYRKFIYALCGYKEINNIEFIGRSAGITPTAQFLVDHNIKIALKASNDPSKYILHSFYDMVRNDYRGRMLRAFPTFYCLFMDEGREIGAWKLHDNFYSINAISDIKIVKSRKIPADTCTILLSNNYATFTTDDEDGYTNYKSATLSDIWTNIFYKREVAYKEEMKRLAANRTNRAKLQAGIRIHVRQGYGSDARELGSAFNGTITEVAPGAQMVNIIAQGDGIELMNPIMDDRDADEIQYEDLFGDSPNNTEGQGATPGKILTSILTTKGGAVNRYIQGEYSEDQSIYERGESYDDSGFFHGLLNIYSQARWVENPYGIYHFGDADYKDVFPGGESIQNIYDVSKFPNMDQGRLELYEESDIEREAPYISFEPRGKTVWEAMHICKSVAPEFMTGIVNFGMRSSIFFGRPHYYYAYDYVKHNGVRIEKRKPYQQYHIYYSDYDIIDNSITASSSNITTCATGLYQDKEGLITSNSATDPLWVDKDIYPEYQKSTVVDTKLKMKDGAWWKTNQFNRTRGSAIGDFLVNTGLNLIQTLVGIPGDIIHTATGWICEQVTEDLNFGGKSYFWGWQNNKKVAWSATADALKESMKEMYQGTLQVLGDPSVKPNDRIILQDAYNDMNGQVLVRNVVHCLSAQTGFTTTIEVDTISTVDEAEEIVKRNVLLDVGRHIAIGKLIQTPIVKMAEKGVVVLGGNLSSLMTWAGNKQLMNKLKVGDILKDVGKSMEILKDRKEVNKLVSITRTTKTLLKSTTKILKMARLLKGGAIAAAITGNEIIAAVAYILSWAVEEVIYAKIINFFTSLIRDRQVLQVFPLQRFGMTYTAGLEGSMGSVYNSVTWDTVGTIEVFVADHFTPNEEDNDLVAGLKAVLLDEGIQNEAAKYRRNNKYNADKKEYGNKDEVNAEKTTKKIMDSSQFHRKTRANGKALTKRVTINSMNESEENKKLYTDSVNRLYVENVKDLLRDEKRKEHCHIMAYSPLMPYVNNFPLLRIAHDSTNLEEGKTVRRLDVQEGRKIRMVNAIIRNEKEKNSKGEIFRENELYDVPYLEKDALEALTSICKKATELLTNSEIGDTVSYENSLNGTSIVVTSAMVIGASDKLLGSGMTFTIIGTGKLSGGVLKKIVDGIIDKEKSINFYDTASFEAVEFENGEIRIMVNPKTPVLFVDKEKDENTDKTDKTTESDTVKDVESIWEEKWWGDEGFNVDIGIKL